MTILFTLNTDSVCILLLSVVMVVFHAKENVSKDDFLAHLFLPQVV
jgi:hypothetical protein